MTKTSRRTFLATGCAGLSLPAPLWAREPRVISWDDLIPPGVPYSEIIGDGEMDETNDTWKPIFDANATRLNPALDGAFIRMPGFILPLEMSSKGVTEFVLVPYVGACLHVPPPPPNQLVLVQTPVPWPSEQMWDAVWVEGTMRALLQTTDVAETGYTLAAESMEIYVWQ